MSGQARLTTFSASERCRSEAKGSPTPIVGLAGNDRIRGLGGNDVICGGAGDDDLDGRDGTDDCRAGLGSDSFLSCEAGD